MQKIKRVNAISFGKILGTIYGVLGLVLGLIVTAIITGNVFFTGNKNYATIFFGFGAIVLIPLVYGLAGFVFGALLGWLYNIAAKRVGGLEIEIGE
ncbi:MAG: hypothetical protein HY918_01695 [Candidatus Doudnabacteria bacterium]|nr:hypothetical protein [Candidatus Doudnabacteria bacterium]